MTYVIGLDVGGTNTKLVAVDPSGVVLRRSHTPTDASSIDALAYALRHAVDESQRALGPAAAIGVAAPGLVRQDAHTVHWMQGRMAVVQGLDWQRVLEWPRPVPLLNDARAALIGETWIGSAHGLRNVMLLTLGTGVGGAAMIDGHVLDGHLGRAGHLGHLTVDAAGRPDIVNTPGSLEDAIGDCTVAERSGGRFTTTAALVAAVQAGDEAARAVWLLSVQRLAAAIASLINVLDPQCVLLGGGIATHAWDTLIAPLQQWLDTYEWRPDGTPTPIVAAALGDEAGAIGAARHAFNLQPRALPLRHEA
jgi:glucokinase